MRRCSRGRAGRAATRAATSLRSQPLHAAAARLSRLHRHLSRPHQDVPRQGCRVQSDRPAGRLWRLSGLVERAGRFRSLGDGQVDFGAIFSKLAAVRFRRLGGARMGMLHQASARTARAKGAEFIADHIIRVTEKAFDDFAGAGTDRRANRRMLGIATRPEASDMAIEAVGCATRGRRCGSAWSAAGAAPSSARCIASRRMDDRLRAGRRRACPRRPKRAKDRAPTSASAADRALSELRRDGGGRGEAAGRHRGRRIVTPNDSHHAIAKRLPRSRHPRHLRQAADHDLADALDLVEAGAQERRSCSA